MPKLQYIIIIGAGPTGLATAITLQEKGYQVTVLEATNELGQGVSNRPGAAPYAIGHSGVYNEPGSVRKRYCEEMHLRMRNPGRDNTVMKIYRRNTITTGKCITARTEKGLESLRQDAGHLKAPNRVRHHFYDNKEKLAGFHDPALVPESLKGILYLSDVWLLNIVEYTKDLSSEFRAKGGKLLLGHKVSGFGEANIGATGTKVRCENGKEFTADAVINMAGLGVAPITTMAQGALKRGGYTGPFPEEPTLNYYRMYGTTTEPAASTSSPYIIYNRENDWQSLSGKLGLHTYPSFEKNGGWHPLFGPISEKVSLEDALKREPYEKEVTENIRQQVSNIFPEADTSKLRFTPLGYRSTATRNKIVDFYQTTLYAPKRGFCVINSHTSDSPGLTTGPVIAEAMGQYIVTRLEKETQLQESTHTARITAERQQLPGKPMAKL